MEHLDCSCVPVGLEAHMAVNLHVVVLTIIERLAYVPGMEGIASFSVLNRRHNDFRRVWAANRLVNHIFDCVVMLLVPLLIYIDLIVNEDVQVAWVFCLVDHISESVRELGVSVRCNANI